MDLVQIAILIFSCSSVWAFAGIKHKRLGFIFGLLGQPFWIYTTYTSKQWGMFIVSLWFTANHVRGLWNYRKQSTLCRSDAERARGYTQAINRIQEVGIEAATKEFTSGQSYPRDPYDLGYEEALFKHAPEYVNEE